MAELLFEIGTEEIPAGFIEPALTYLADTLRSRLAESHLSVETIQTEGTPRRLVLFALGLPGAQIDRDEQVLGPPQRIAYDAQGNLTRAGEGFAKSQGVSPTAITVVETEKGAYLAVQKRHRGLPLAEVLATLLPQLLESLPFPKSMRWGTGHTAFARPIHWIVALVDGEVVSFQFADVQSGNCTVGHRFSYPEPVPVASVAGYRQALEARGVVLEASRRKALILDGANALAQSVGGQLVDDPQLLQTVCYITEDPQPLLGHFNAEFLFLPRELLITTMRYHQKYFSVVDGDGKLLPHFVVAANTRVRDPRVVARGNERVLHARLADAKFFWETDLKKPLADYTDALRGRVFLKGLGSVADKVDRVEALAVELAERIGFGDLPAVRLTARLCKCDLATELVGEFPELQGIVGREYAKQQGVSPLVASAIFEHYLPRGASDALPSSEIAALVGVADKLDSVIACFCLGIKVSGTQDPYALRRQCLGVIRILLDRGWPVAFDEMLALAERIVREQSQSLGGKVITAQEGDDARSRASMFAQERLRHMLSETYPLDVVNAVLEARFAELRDVTQRVEALCELKQSPDFETLAIAWKRMANITRKNPPNRPQVDVERFEYDAERQLFQTAQAVGELVQQALQTRDYRAALGQMIALKPVVDKFFDDVLVMDDDEATRDNRLALLLAVQSLFSNIADFTRIQT